MDDRKITAPTVHRMEGELRVCDPLKVDHTKDMESWRILRIMDELIRGFETLRKYRLAATFFGSSRCTFEDQIYKDAERLAGMLARSNFAVISGGAGGIMEAANKGAFEAGGQSVGLNIKLPDEQGGNRYTTETMNFNYFFTRRVMLSFASEVYIVFPGGFGTLDEFFEVLTLVQTNKIKRIPIILYGATFWTPLIAFMRDQLIPNKAIDPEDLDLFVLADSVEDAYEKIVTLVKC